MPHYVFAGISQKASSFTARVNYTVTPDLTVELYAAPFTSTGVFTNYKEISSTPLADDYGARFTPYTPPSAPATDNFKFAQLRTNSVVRWEFRPGSTMFVVWQHGRQDTQNPGQSWTADYRDLFDRHPDNVFLVKLAYWLNR